MLKNRRCLLRILIKQPRNFVGDSVDQQMQWAHVRPELCRGAGGAPEPAPDLISRVKISPGPGVARPGPAPAARRKNWLARHFLCPHFLPPSAAQSGAGVGILTDLPE